MIDEDWIANAECRRSGIATDLFFPPPGDGYAVARACCYRCKVRAECLEDCMRAERKQASGRVSRDGMYGGLTPGERAALVKKKRAANVTESNVCAGTLGAPEKSGGRAAQTAGPRDQELSRSPQ